jgi:hypothetical protein
LALVKHLHDREELPMTNKKYLKRGVKLTVFHTTTLFCMSLSFSASADLIPLISSKWTALNYNGIPANSVWFEKNEIVVEVNKSAGPLVYKLDKPGIVKKITVEATLQGSKAVETGTHDEDAVLRVGLVAIGDKTLTGVKKFFAPNWVKKLFELAPTNIGLDKIHFYNTTNRQNQLGVVRQYPASELIIESWTTFVGKEGPFNMLIELAKPLPVAALWLSIDGDSSQSKFSTRISKIDMDLEQRK